MTTSRVSIEVKHHRPVRRGFTLVELLVVVTVLLILMVMTVTAIDFTFKSERVRSATRQVQSALEGARDRAIAANDRRGLRFLVEPGEDRNGNGVLDTEDLNGNGVLDPGEDLNGNGVLDTEDLNGNGILDAGDPRIVTRMIYVSAPLSWSKGRIQSLERWDADNNGTIDTSAGESTKIQIARGSPDCGWYTLKERGFFPQDFEPPAQIIINGQPYAVLTNLLTPSNQLLRLVPEYSDDAGATSGSQVVALSGGLYSKYVLELPPRVLPDAKPILLPDGVCIDLDGSDVPAGWRPPSGASVTAPYLSRMDIVFSPRGVVSWPSDVAARGLIHLYLAERKDVVRAVDIGVDHDMDPLTPDIPRGAVNFGDTARVPDLNQFNPDEAVGQRKVITIFTQTGKVSSHEINPTPNSTPNGYAANPFEYATKGEAQSQ
jgi:prepilin-type N-terminal cleavage/methylation domain-containing protein